MWWLRQVTLGLLLSRSHQCERPKIKTGLFSLFSFLPPPQLLGLAGTQQGFDQF